jgi:hypothetical protein
MNMPSALRKFVLTLHLTASVGWVGAVLAFLALVFTAMNSASSQTLIAAWLAMAWIGWYIIVPLALAALLTGIIISLGTKWRLFRHYWVIFSLVLTLFATAVLLEHMETVTYFAGIASDPASADMDALRGGLSGELLHAGLGLLVLLVVQVMNIYKPKGLTPWGWRKQQEELLRKQTRPDE